MSRIEQILSRFLVGGLVLLAACSVGEGQRCNPLLFQNDTSCVPGTSCQDDCPQNLVCVYPPGCGVAYCCPASSDLGVCQPCVMDLGERDAGTDAHRG